MKASFLHTHALAVTGILAATVLTGCHTTSLQSIWKAPDHKGGPVQKLAILAVADKGLVRGGFENRFTTALAKGGQAAFATYETLALPEIKANKDAAATRLRQAGADTILILRFVNSSTRVSEVRESRELHVPVTTGMYTDGWYDWYSVAFVDMSTVRSSTRKDVYLDTSVFDLTTGKRIWSCASDTTVKDDVDRLDLADAFVARVVAALRKDGLVR
jgi:hypothetical protein